MTKTAKTLEEYPVRERLNKKATGVYDPNLPRRQAYTKGYQQAIDDALEWLGGGRIWEYIAYDDEADMLYMTGNLYEDLRKHLEE